MPDGLKALPMSPLPTLAEAARADLEERIAHYAERLRVGQPPRYWDDTLGSYLAYVGNRLTELRRKLRKLDD